jgi:HAD superfamily hydrolase (TIGR01509 family)
LPGIVRLLEEAHELNLRCAIASSSPSDWVRGHLDRVSLLKYFHFISCAENGCPPKPSPDVYLRALKGLDVSASEAIAIEDSPNGFKATRIAGIRCVIVPNQLTRLMKFPQDSKFLGSLEEFSLKTELQM